MSAQSGFVYVQTNGTLTIEGVKLFRDLETRAAALEAKFAAIAAIVAPTGGATTDTEARAAIVAILGAV